MTTTSWKAPRCACGHRKSHHSRDSHHKPPKSGYCFDYDCGCRRYAPVDGFPEARSHRANPAAARDGRPAYIQEPFSV